MRGSEHEVRRIPAPYAQLINDILNARGVYANDPDITDALLNPARYEGV